MQEHALRRMMFEFITSYDEEERDRIQFFPDEWQEDYCAWSFLLGRHKITWKYIYETDSIEKECFDFVKFMAR